MQNFLTSLFGRSRNGRDNAQAHMTFGQTSMGRSMTRTKLLLKKQLWVWPIIAVVLLAVIGYSVSSLIHRTMEDNLRSELTTLLTVEKSMLEKWLKVQEAAAVSLANNPDIRKSAIDLLSLAAEAPSNGPTTESDSVDRSKIGREENALRASLGRQIEPVMTAHDFVGYVLIDKKYQIIATTHTEMLGQAAPRQFEDLLAQVLSGKSLVSVPYQSIAVVKDRNGQSRTRVPTMIVSAPVRDENLQIVAALCLRIQPEKEFTNILQLGRMGDTGETYAINKDGLMVSNSRFDDQLRLLRVLPEDEASILKVQVRDPGGDMTQGFRPEKLPSQLPLTKSAASLARGESEVSMDSYRGYRGVDKIGAWTWLPDYQMGLITEINSGEAFLPLTILKRTFYVLYAFLGIGALAIFVFTLVVARLQRQARKAAVEAKQLGQYRLLDKLGAGAMGVVYKGQHAMLRRPTAIKMLDVERVNEASIQRFEREVQITCNLNNPHTVAIYDYGRTPEGVFYYAMEFLDGINLQTLVEEDGPQPEGRVVSILRQVCASLYEAHSLGLVHRDIKPANIMLNRRGAEPDVVKVLDFGLVKAVDEKKDGQQAGADMSGTPLYMSPEAIQMPDSVDARSDLYAVGAVGYFLITGQTAFNARTLSELCQQHVSATPEAPSQRLGRVVSPELEHAILACLEKNRAKRPQTARDLSAMLDRVADKWSIDDAEEWWSRHERGQPNIAALARSTTSVLGKPPTSATASDSPSQPATPNSATVSPSFDSTMMFNPPGDSAK
jgi:eukaryotic-like serine/threonine-protein kinase